MPPVIVGIAAGVAAAGVVSTAAAIAIGIGAAALTYAATPKFDGGSFANEAFSQQQMLRSPVEPRRGIYGRAMVSGPLVFAEETGTDNAYLHLVIPLAGHRCDGIEKIYFGDDVAWANGALTAKYASVARIKIHLGNQTTSDPDLTAECRQWTSAHVGFGVTYLYARLKFDTKVFPNGVPNIKALVRGKQVYDPRKTTHNWSDPATWEWSDNWALCCLDYNRFEAGVGAAAHEIDLSYFAAAANDSDQLVEYKTGKFEKRYTCNGTYNTDVSPSSIMEKMLTAGAGMHVYVSGQYRLYAGVYQGPEVLVLTEDDAAGDIDVRPYTPRSDLCNAVRGTFVDPENFYQPTDFPPYESSYYRAQDDGEYIDHDLDLPFTQSVWTAQRLGKLYLEQKRAGMQISMPVKMIGVAVSVGKVVGLSLPRLGIDGTFQIVDWQFDYGKPVSLILVETSPELFDYAMGSYTERDLTPNVILPNPATVPTPVGLQYVEYQDDPQWQGELTWSAPANNSSYRYVIEVSNGLGEVVYQTNADATRLLLPKFDAGFYTVSVWALNLFANRSNAPATITIGATLPAPVTGIEVIAGPLTLTLRPTTAAAIAQTTQFEILGSITNNIADAALIGTGKDAVWPDRHPNTRYQVWARTINNYGASSWYGPVQATTSADNSSIIDLIGNTFKSYTWFAWADDNQGTGFTTVEALGDGKAYMGLATDKPTATPSGNWQDYTWSKIKPDIGPIFTPEEEAKLDNLMAGKLPFAPDKDMLAAQDALNNPALANNLITALSLLNQGINAPALGGETPASAQAKADAAQNAAINAAAASAATLANNARAQAEANAALDALNKANAAKSDAIKINDTLVLTNYGDWCYSLGNTCGHNNPYNDAWDGCVFSKLNYHGGALAVATIENLSGLSRRAMFGLSSMPLSSASFNDINFAIYADLHNYQVYENGLFKSVLLAKSPEVGDVLSVKYDGSKVYYSINGIVLKEDNAVRDLRLHLKTAFFGTEFNWKNIALSPLSNMMVAFDDATNKANSALLLANAALNARVNEDEALSIDNLLSPAGLPYKKDIIIYGDSNKYYPVVFSYGDQSINRRIKIWRGYYEQGPDDWWAPTHKGQLNIDWFGNFGGWGGAGYFEQLLTHTEMYAELLADAYVFGSGMLYCFMLRGGGSVGAIYHIASDMNVMPTVYYNQDLLISAAGAYAPAPTTSVNHERINSLKIGNSTIGNLLAYSAQFNSLKSKMASFGGLTAETISSLAIATNHLQSGAVTADKLTADTALIQKLISNIGLFNQLQAQLAAFGGLAANSIAAKAITVDKLDVLSRNLVNNFSITGERTGWNGGFPIVDFQHKGQWIKAMLCRTSGDVQVVSDTFDIDHSKIYEVNFTIYRNFGGHNGERYFGVYVDGDGVVDHYTANDQTYLGSNANFYFWSGIINNASYHQMRSYIVGSEVDLSAIPECLNVHKFCKLRPGTKKVLLRVLNYYNGGVETEDVWLNPSVTELGGGQISANQIIANSALFDKLKARIGAFGGLTANEIQADTALINKLVGTSALFNDLVARLAVFGGLTANSIASDAILGRHIRAGEKISSPIIEGGEVRLIGTAFMKVQSATPFGPDGLVEWYGPKLLVNGAPDWANIRKSNATTYLAANGDAYFGGSLSAGVLKNGSSNTTITLYPTSSVPVEVGPFGTNGKVKNVVVSYNCTAGYSQTTEPGNVTITEVLRWQVQRNINGSWQNVTGASGTFTGTVLKSADTETIPTTYRVSYACSGSATFTDSNASTANVTYRIVITSHTRPFNNAIVSQQSLSLISTEQ